MSLPEQLAELERRIRARHEAAVADLRREYEARLRRTSEDLLAGLGELRAPVFQPLTEADAVALAPRDSGRDEVLADLVAGARALDAAAGQAAVLEALLEAARRFADRTGLLLVREDGLTGWASAGFDGDPFSGRELGWDESLPAPADAGRGAVRLDGDAARRFAHRLGVATAPAHAVLVPLVLRDRVAAALYADRSGEGPEPPLGALQLLVQLAAARLELQPLSERSYSPTLYEVAEAPAAPLPLWISEPPAPEAPPAPEIPPAALETPVAPAATFAPEVPLAAPSFEPEPAAAAPEPAWRQPEPPAAAEPEARREEPAAPLGEPAVEAAGWPEPPVAVEPPVETAREQVENLFLAEPAEPAPAAEPAPPAGLEPWAAAAPAAPALEDSLWGTGASTMDAATAGFAVEPAPEEPAAPAPPPVAAPEPAAEISEATVRIPVYRPTPAPEPARPLAGISTQEVPQAAPASAPPPAPRDATEDATVLVRRATAPVPAPPPAAPEEEVSERTAVRSAGRTTEVAPPPDVSGPGLAFAAGRTVRTTGENALHDEARRLARLLVSEIKLYNEEQVLEGRRNRDLYVRLKEDIDRSRQIYDERVHESVRTTTDYFHQELVRSLAGGDARALGL
jgi:hypothetical protein